MKVVMIGCDLTSNGGIASVCRTIFKESEKNKEIDYTLIKTTFYKDRGSLANVAIFFLALVKSLYYIIFCDVVHLQGSSHSSFYRKAIILILAKLLGKPVVWNFHASRFLEFFSNNSLLRKKIFAYLLRLSDANIVLCNLFKVKLESEYGLNNVLVLRNPAEPLNFSHSKINKKIDLLKNDSRFKALFIGFYIENKGILDLLKVAEKTAENNIVYAFAGKGELESTIQAKSKSLNNIINLGWLDSAEKAAALKTADLLVLPSYREGMPIVILEAMYAGIPVISTNIAGIPEQITDGQNGYLYEPGDINKLEELILLLARENLKDKAMAFNQSKILEFQPSSILNELLQIYRKVSK